MKWIKDKLKSWLFPDLKDGPPPPKRSPRKVEPNFINISNYEFGILTVDYFSPDHMLRFQCDLDLVLVMEHLADFYPQVTQEMAAQFRRVSNCGKREDAPDRVKLPHRKGKK